MKIIASTRDEIVTQIGEQSFIVEFRTGGGHGRLCDCSCCLEDHHSVLEEVDEFTKKKRERAA